MPTFRLLQGHLRSDRSEATQTSPAGPTYLSFPAASQPADPHLPQRIFLRASPYFITERYHLSNDVLLPGLGLSIDDAPHVRWVRRGSCGLAFTIVHLDSVQILQRTDQPSPDSGSSTMSSLALSTPSHSVIRRLSAQPSSPSRDTRLAASSRLRSACSSMQTERFPRTLPQGRWRARACLQHLTQSPTRSTEIVSSDLQHRTGASRRGSSAAKRQV